MSRHDTAAPHVTPLWLYLAVAGALMFLTVVTVAVSVVDFGHLVGVPALNLMIAMAVATAKATLVALIFMHLLHDHKLYSLVLVIGLLTLATFIVLTMFDTLNRGSLYPIEGQFVPMAPTTPAP